MDNNTDTNNSQNEQTSNKRPTHRVFKPRDNGQWREVGAAWEFQDTKTGKVGFTMVIDEGIALSGRIVVQPAIYKNIH